MAAGLLWNVLWGTALRLRYLHVVGLRLVDPRVVDGALELPSDLRLVLTCLLHYWLIVGHVGICLCILLHGLEIIEGHTILHLHE